MVLWRLCYKLSLRDLTEMFLLRGIVFSYEAVRDWEAKLTPGDQRDGAGMRASRATIMRVSRAGAALPR